MALMLNIVQFAWWTVKRKKGQVSHCQRYGPVYLLLLSALLVNIQPMCMLIISSWKLPNFFFDGGDTGAFCMDGSGCQHKACASTTLFDCDNSTGVCKPHACTNLTKAAAEALDCGCQVDSNALYPNTTIGVVIQIFGTYFGFVLMFIGVTWATQLHKKVMARWRTIRGAANAGASSHKRTASADGSAPVAAPAAVANADCPTGD